jgi:hypothetical protein
MSQILLATDVASGLILHWSFDDGTASDTAGARYQGQPQLSPTYAPGIVPAPGVAPGALKFDGTSQYVISSGGAINIPQASSSIWIKVASAPGSDSCISMVCNAFNNITYDKILYMTSTGTIKWETYDGSIKTAVGSTVVSDNNWHHLVGTNDGTTSRLYIDGKQEATVAAGLTYAGYASAGFVVGGHNTNSLPLGWLAGTFDDARLYNRALTPGEINTLYNSAFLPWMESELLSIQLGAIQPPPPQLMTWCYG